MEKTLTPHFITSVGRFRRVCPIDLLRIKAPRACDLLADALHRAICVRPILDWSAPTSTASVAASTKAGELAAFPWPLDVRSARHASRALRVASESASRLVAHLGGRDRGEPI